MRLAQGHDAVKAYRAELAQIFARFPSAAAQLRVSGTAQHFLAGVVDLMARHAQIRDKMLSEQDRMFLQFDGVVALLTHPRGRWRVDGKRLGFSNEQDLYDYDVDVAKVQGLQAVINADSQALGSGTVYAPPPPD
jgi:hypothetical protein